MQPQPKYNQELHKELTMITQNVTDNLDEQSISITLNITQNPNEQPTSVTQNLDEKLTRISQNIDEEDSLEQTAMTQDLDAQPRSKRNVTDMHPQPKYSQELQKDLTMIILASVTALFGMVMVACMIVMIRNARRRERERLQTETRIKLLEYVLILNPI